jgi:hypothetical protein
MAAHGFGRGAFGHGPFGEARWGYETLWNSVPAVHKTLDTDNDDLLQKFMLGIADATDLLRRQARWWPDQKDARVSRTRFDFNIDITLGSDSVFVSAAESEDGRSYIILEVSSETQISDEPFVVGTDYLFPGWTLEAENRTYFVRKYEKQTKVLEVYGDVTDGVPAGATQRLRPPSMIARLGYEYNVEVDGNEPEDFQRSTVYDAVKWFNLKGTVDGIQLRARVAGFDAEVISLYRIGGDYSDWIGPDNVVEIPDGSGNFYSSLGPALFKFDDIAADVLPLDGHCDITVQPVWTYNITSSTFDSVSGLWTMIGTFTTDQPVGGATGGGRWLMTNDADPTESYFIENPQNLSGVTTGLNAVTAVYAPDGVTPSNGDYTVTYECLEEPTCSWCKSYKIQLVLTIVDPQLIGNAKALEGAFDRLLRKLDELIPAHVELTQIVFTESTTAELEISVTSLSQTFEFPNYDDIAADVQPTDTPSVITVH